MPRQAAKSGWHKLSAGSFECPALASPTLHPSRLQIDRPGSRVFLLKFAAEPDRNLFFWAQEPDAAQDAEYVAAVNNVLNAGLEGE